MTKKEGPFDLISKLRDFMYSIKYFGVILFKMMNCAFCSGFWFGIIFHILFESFSKYSIVFAFASGFASYLFSLFIEEKINIDTN